MFFLRLNRLATVSLILISSALIFIFVYSPGFQGGYASRRIPWFKHDEIEDHQSRPDLPRVSCIGPRGKLLSESPEDLPRSHYLNYEYPKPLGGSYEALGLHQTWMTAEDRYGPYGFGDGSPVSTSRTSVDWESVNWGQLQDDCLFRNSHRFGNTRGIKNHPELSLANLKRHTGTLSKRAPVHDTKSNSGRTALILRTWSTYEYKKSDMVALRSLIAETALASGAEYSVFLLVHVKDKGKDIYRDSATYEAVLNSTVPQELRSIAVLFDESLLEKSYPKVNDHSLASQTFQPVQLFAQVYDEFDHYWQVEMDIRFMGNTLDYLEAISKFAKAEPRKQSVERASFRYLPSVHGTYQDFLSAVNTSVQGKGIWGPVSIPEVKDPIGPAPPTRDPIDDNFEWGVGFDADFIPTVPCKSLPLTTSWPYKGLMSGFSEGEKMLRLFCPQAVSRLSWNLLNAVHTAQLEQGLRIGAEATMPSFALWHGLKISHPPQPWFVEGQQDIHKLDSLINGGAPQSKHAGFSYGTTSHDTSALTYFNFEFQQNWWFRSDFPEKLMDIWMSNSPQPNDAKGIPEMLRLHEGKIYAPVVALHPVKTNQNPT